MPRHQHPESARHIKNQMLTGPINRREFLRMASALGITAVTPSLLSACAAGNKTPDQPTRLVYQDWRTDWFPPMAQEMLAQFHSANPDTRVFYTPDPPNIEEAMVIAFQNGTAPDLLQGCCAFFPSWGQQGHLLDLAPYIARDLDQATLDDWNKAQFNAFSTVEGVQFALPKYHGALALYYNKDLFDHYGVAYPNGNWDHDDYLAAMRQLTHDRDKDGQIDLWGSMIDISWDRLQMHINGFGGHFVDPADPTRCLMGEPAALEAFQWLHDRMWQDHVMATFLDVENLETRQAFIGQQIAMVEDGSWALKDILAQSEFRVGVAPFPSGPVKQVTLATTDGFAIYANTQYPDEAWELMKFLVSKEYGRAMAQSNFLQPARASLVEEWAGFIRAEFPEKTEEMDLTAFADGHINGYSVTVETFANMSEATQLASESWNKIFTLNQRPVSAIKQLSQDIENSQEGG